ncbi:NAD(P)/FAD-dependent oxidoreductase, partial [Mesorhizobium sp.]|uniref:NAD(P)/FAD-dependent oxidoreductase n=1 Tax=Mesorhizobium sp. TaxID=1871066 RepID=UPI0025EB8CA2
MPSNKDDSYEVAIVGGGPAGLAAAVYLGRFLRSAIVFDAGDARAKLIPKTHNCPGFPEGISGMSLLKRLKRQATRYGSRIVAGRVEWLKQDQGGFLLQTSLGPIGARCVILATGIVDHAPAIPNIREAIAAGSIRLCPVCDAYEVQGRRVGVVGPEDAALREANFLRHFTPHVSILCNFPADFSSSGRALAKREGLDVLDAVDDLL